MPKSLLIGVDTSDASKKALEWTLKNIYSKGDTIHVVYCYPPLDSYVGPEFVSVPTQKQQEQWKKAEEASFDKFLADTSLRKDSSIAFVGHIVSGDPREVLRTKSDEYNAHTVVVGSHGKGLLQRALLGSVSSYLAQNMQRPLVIVPKN